jgi:hypothetical protein
MRSNKTSGFGMNHGQSHLATSGPLQAVQIAGDLIAFYPQAIHQPQPMSSCSIRRVAFSSASTCKGNDIFAVRRNAVSCVRRRISGTQNQPVVGIVRCAAEDHGVAKGVQRRTTAHQFGIPNSALKM